MGNYTHGDIAQFQNDRLGLFIHWGVYSMYGINEWCRRNERISEEDYKFLIDNFDPDLFDPAEWAKAARNADEIRCICYQALRRFLYVGY